MERLFKVTAIIMLLTSMSIKAQQDKNPNVFLITLDGVRWQDVFTGMDTNLFMSTYTPCSVTR